MDEPTWLASNDPQAMLVWLTADAGTSGGSPRLPPSARKLALFVEASHALCNCPVYAGAGQDAGYSAALTDVDGCACTRAARAALLRCLFGNPWRPVRYVRPEDEMGWVPPGPRYRIPTSWLTPTVRHLARSIYADRDFAALPLLADALEEAGCQEEALLRHLRGPGPHARGCWVLDLVLGKE